VTEQMEVQGERNVDRGGFNIEEKEGKMEDDAMGKEGSGRE